MASSLPWKTRIGLILFGLGSALVASVVILQFAPITPVGTEFDSIEDVRRAMLRDDSREPPPSSTDTPSVSLKAIVQPHESDRLIYTLKPHLDLTFIRARVETNSCGMRSPERPIAKPAGVYRIALLGDSFTFGWGVEQNETFAQVLEDNLNRMYRGAPKIEVLNFGVPGYSTFQEVELFEQIGLQFQPDAVLVYFVENDFGMPFFIRDLDGSGGILSSLRFVQLGRKLLAPGEMQKKIDELGLDPSRALLRLDEVVSQHGIRTFFTINPKKKYRKHLKRLWALRQTDAIEVISLREPLMEYIRRHNIAEKDLTLSFDPHPSPIRHRILGNVMAPYFMEAIG